MFNLFTCLWSDKVPKGYHLVSLLRFIGDNLYPFARNNAINPVLYCRCPNPTAIKHEPSLILYIILGTHIWFLFIVPSLNHSAVTSSESFISDCIELT